MQVERRPETHTLPRAARPRRQVGWSDRERALARRPSIQAVQGRGRRSPCRDPWLPTCESVPQTALLPWTPPGRGHKRGKLCSTQHVPLYALQTPPCIAQAPASTSHRLADAPCTHPAMAPKRAHEEAGGAQEEAQVTDGACMHCGRAAGRAAVHPSRMWCGCMAPCSRCRPDAAPLSTPMHEIASADGHCAAATAPPPPPPPNSPAAAACPRAQGEEIVLPKKAMYRMRAHSNPLNDAHFPVPVGPDAYDWCAHAHGGGGGGGGASSRDATWLSELSDGVLHPQCRLAARWGASGAARLHDQRGELMCWEQ